jgi:mRNA interferase MazF
VVSRDDVGRLPLRIIVPITEWKASYPAFPWFVEIPADAPGLQKPSGADAFQMQSLSLARFARHLGVVSGAPHEAVEDRRVLVGAGAADAQ